MNEIYSRHCNTTTTPLISVVTCTRNRAHILFRVLESLRMQTYPNWEAIVVDDYSDDATWRTLGYVNDSRIRYVRNDRTQGVLEARNLGVALAKGTIISYLDDDVVLYPTGLEALSEMPDEASWGAYYRNTTVVQLENQCEVARCRGTSAGREISRSSLIALETGIDTNCLFHRPEVLSDVGGWRSLVRPTAFEDTYLAASLALKHFDGFWLLPQVLVDYQTTVGTDGDGLWGKYGFQLEADFLTKWLGEFGDELSEEQRLSIQKRAALSKERALLNEPYWQTAFRRADVDAESNNSILGRRGRGRQNNSSARTLGYGWGVAPELPTLFPCQPWSHLLNDTDMHSQIRGQQHFLRMEVERYSTAIKTNAPRLAFDRSFFSTIAYSYAIEQYWCNNVYESTLSLLFDMLECKHLKVPRLLVLLEAPLMVRQWRCLRRDSRMTVSAHDMADSELHRSRLFAGALTHFYSMLPDRIGQLLPLVKIRNTGVTTQEIAGIVHRATSQIESTPPDPSLASLFNALSNPSVWESCANQDSYDEIPEIEGD